MVLRMATGSVLAAGLLVLGGGYAPGARPLAHTCSATDRQFLQVATVNVAGFEPATPGEALDAAATVRGAAPRDRSLRQAQAFFGGMLLEEGRALEAKERHEGGDADLRRAHRFAGYARAVLQESGPALSALGCDVAPLL